MTPHTACEILTVAEYAQRMKVSRATVFTWMQKGFLVTGEHFIRLGRVLRFIWRVDHFIQPLPEDRLKVRGHPHDAGQTASGGRSGRLPAGSDLKPIRKKAAPINWDY